MLNAQIEREISASPFWGPAQLPTIAQFSRDILSVTGTERLLVQRGYFRPLHAGHRI